MDPLLDGILPPGEKSDMKLVGRIPRIIRERRSDVAQELLDRFPMWYHGDIAKTSQVFWSENHYIMHASSDLLLREMMNREIPDTLYKRVEVFLRLKSELGCAEFLSPVYLPFTISAFLNIYDFTRYQELRVLARRALDLLAKQILSVTLPSGALVSPSGRAYSRHRVKTTGLHLNVFTEFLVTRRNTDRSRYQGEMALVETLSSTTYVPSESVYENFVTEKDTELQLSPRLDDLRAFFDRVGVSSDVKASLMWNHGIYLPAKYCEVADVLRFMDDHGLWAHPHFRALQSTRKILGRVLKPGSVAFLIYLLISFFVVSTVARGAYLTDARLRVYREGNVILSSLMNYNSGLPSFQQWPWAINLAGTAVWCSYGSVNAAGLKTLGNKEAAAELSTARLIPFMYQTGRRLFAVYRAPSWVFRLANIRIRPIMRWPTADFDEHGQKEIGTQTWFWAKKQSAFMAYNIHKSVVSVVVRDLVLTGMTVDEALGSI